MKQVLIQSNNNYLFPLPQSYELLVREISNKLNISKENINIHNNGHIVTKNNYKNINDNLNILDVNANLNGGSGFPNFNNMVMVSILQWLLPALLSVILLLVLSFIIKHSLEKPKKLKNKTGIALDTLGSKTNDAFEIAASLNFVPNLDNYVLFKEFFILSILIYIFSVTPALTISGIKSKHCPTYKTNWSLYLPLLFAPFPILLFLCWFHMKRHGTMNNPLSIYIGAGSLFIVCGLLILSSVNNSLVEWEHDDVVKDSYQKLGLRVIPLVASMCYLVLRLLLIWSNFNLGVFKGIFVMGIIFLLVSFSVTPDFTSAYINYISSPFSKCPQK